MLGTPVNHVRDVLPSRIQIIIISLCQDLMRLQNRKQQRHWHILGMEQTRRECGIMHMQTSTAYICICACICKPPQEHAVLTHSEGDTPNVYGFNCRGRPNHVKWQCHVFEDALQNNSSIQSNGHTPTHGRTAKRGINRSKPCMTILHDGSTQGGAGWNAPRAAGKEASPSAKQSVSNYQSGRRIETPTLYLSPLVSILYTVRKWTLLNLAPAASQASRDVEREES